MKFKISSLLLLVFFIVSWPSCSDSGDHVSKTDKIKLLVVHAGSLSLPFREISKGFEKKYPNVKVLLEGYGSRTAARQVSDLKMNVDVLGSADSDVIKKLLYPEYADFCIDFVSNEMVIAFTEKSKNSRVIDSGNWYEILLMDGVEPGHSDPDCDPCGYRSVFTMELAEKFYGEKGLFKKLQGKIRKKNIRAKETDLLALLEAGELDYIYIYKSVAVQHGLKYVELPGEVNLGISEYKDLYGTVNISLSGKKPGQFIEKKGAPMIYGLTIPKLSENRSYAEKFIIYIISEEGKEIMKKMGQPLLDPPYVDNPENLPESLRRYFKN
ncbi:MAG: tungstate ABC transporter substrate-binding protein WtpA [Acidobacteriota bacterium]